MRARCTALQLMGMGHAAALQAGRERELGQPVSGPPVVDATPHGIMAHFGSQAALCRREASGTVSGRGAGQGQGTASDAGHVAALQEVVEGAVSTRDCFAQRQGLYGA